MRKQRRKHQAGYALLLMVVGLMGIGGVVLASFTQQASKDLEQRRYEHNQRVLEEAKQALLLYAYRYPEIAGRGPGRLPCPDTDVNDDGISNPGPACTAGLNAMVGRLPWGEVGIDFYDIRDASGERLWYAVSRNFAEFLAGNRINSDAAGSITVHDQNGGMLYDGDPAAGTGVAAVIIAPGPPIRLDEDDDGVYEYNQVRTTPFEQGDPRNYLDTFNLFTNNAFNNNESDTDNDGFIYGPVVEDDPASPFFDQVVINDQMIVITAEELIAVAEKSVFQTYRQAIREYQDNIGIERYPWLDTYDSDDGLGTFNAVRTPLTNPNLGRLPSLFADYFAANGTPTPWMRPRLRLSITIDDEVHNMTLPLPAAQDVRFEANGDLTSAIQEGLPITRFFWDGDGLPLGDPNQQDNIWEMCPTVTFDEEDCNRNAAGVFVGGGSSPVELRTREINITFDGGGADILFRFADRTAANLEYWREVPENPHPENPVYIAAEYDDSPPTNYIADFSYQGDDDFQNSHDAPTPAANFGTLVFGNGAADSIKVGLPYYPTLPQWVLDNNWHDMMMVAYSSAMQPGGDGDCSVGIDDCLTVRYPDGVTRLEPAILLLSGAELDFDPDVVALVDDTDNGNPPYFLDELGDIFDAENADNPPDLVFDYRDLNGNDEMLFLE